MAGNAVAAILEAFALNRDEWAQFSATAHEAVFGTVKPNTFDRIDYAWLVVAGDKPVSYVTVRELDHETVYWQYGGGFPWAWKSILMTTSLRLLLHEQSKLSKRITMRVSNKNVAMLRLAMGLGFLIFGTRFVENEVFVELGRDLNGDEPNVSKHAQSDVSVRDTPDGGA